MALLIAPTLLNSYNWLRKCPPSWKDRAYQDIMNTLNRAPFKPNEAMQRGNDFEDAVYRHANTDLDMLEASENFKKVCRRVRGYTYQKRLKLFFDVDDKQYCCFGRADCYSKEEIVDIKTTASFKGNSQYLSGWQHLFYTGIAGVPRFTYLVAEWADDMSIKDVHEVPYVMETKEKTFALIADGIREFMDYISHDDEMYKAYHKVYNR